MQQVSRLAYVLRLLAGLVIISMVMGVLAAAVLLPTVGVAGSATKGMINTFNNMPDNMTMTPLAQQTKILAADGSVIATPYNDNRVPVPLSKIAPIMREAQVAIEDQRFYEHGGVDARGLVRAVASNLFGGGTQGASTLTQQYVKVALQDQALAGGNQAAAQAQVTQSGMKGYVRKLQQLRYAVALEQKYSKDDILDGYLNLVYFGDQQYGIEAAAIHYYGVHASQLNLNEAATLAGVVNAPGVTDPVNYPQNAKVRRNLVLQKMYENKYITRKQMLDTQKEPIVTHLGKNVGSSCANSKYPYFCYYVAAWLLQQPALGKTAKDREALLKSGGLTIKTTLDPKMADIVNQQIKAKVPVGNDADVQAAGVIVQPGTGKVLAMGQNTTYSNTNGKGKSALNFNTPFGLGGPIDGFAFGSTDKLFTMIDAIKNHYPLNSTVLVPPADGKLPNGAQTTQFSSADFPSNKCGLGPGEPWNLPNDQTFKSGPQSYVDITAQSINTAFATLVSQLGACNVQQTMTEMGLRQSNGKEIPKLPSAISLGTAGVAPVTLAESYATVDAGGKWCPARPVDQIIDAHGNNLKLQGIGCKQVVDKNVANTAIKLFHAPIDNPNGTATDAKLAGGRPAWGKTGTTDGATQTWFVGATPQITTAVWVGRLNSQAPLKNITLAGQHYGTAKDPFVYGGTLAAPLWKIIMDDVLQGQPIQQFTEPPANMVNGNVVKVPKVTGMSISEATSRLQNAGFKVVVGRAKNSNDYGYGLIMLSNPGGDTEQPPGTTVTIFPSTGNKVNLQHAAR